ncbi:MAG: calcium-binding protein [Bryobacteraceae bacterium]
MVDGSRRGASLLESFRRSVTGNPSKSSVWRLKTPPEDACSADMLVLLRWHGRTTAVPLSQLVAIDPDESTAEAIGGWHYWVEQGNCF